VQHRRLGIDVGDRGIQTWIRRETSWDHRTAPPVGTTWEAAQPDAPKIGAPVGGSVRSHVPLALVDNCLYTISVRFEWDLPKARANLRVHGVSFAEAATVLEDNFALTRDDPDDVDEQRFVSLGLSDLGNLLVVVYTYREPDTIRLISAWRATKCQRMLYEKGRC